MKSSRILIRRPADPLQSEIDRRLAAKRSAEKRDPISAPVAGVRALRALAASIRESLTVGREVG